MPATNAELIQLYGGLDTAIWVGDKLGRTLPENLSQPGAGFTPLGWLEQDTGVVFNVEKEFSEVVALQGATVVKRAITKVMQRLAFAALEDSLLVRELAFGNKFVVSGTGPAAIAKQDIASNQNAQIIRPVIVDVASTTTGVPIERYCFSAVELTWQGELALAKSDGTPRAYSFDALVAGGAAGYVLTSRADVLADAKLPAVP